MLYYVKRFALHQRKEKKKCLKRTFKLPSCWIFTAMFCRNTTERYLSFITQRICRLPKLLIRQGVRHIIKKGEENLLFWEERLHLANRYKRMKEAAEKLLSLTDALEEGEDAVALAKEMRSCANTILENNQA